MFKMSLDISFSGLLRHVLAYFTEKGVVLMLLERVAQCQPPNISETQTFNSTEFTTASSSKHITTFFEHEHITTSNQLRLKTDVSVDSMVKQENLFSMFRNEASLSSEVEVVKRSGATSHPRSKGKGVVQTSEAEELNTRLTILEAENEIMKQAFLETVMERKELVNEICQLFQTLGCSFHPKHQQHGQRSSAYGSLIIKS